MLQNRDILVLGCGVSGLSTGILLFKKGCRVSIWAKDLPPNTTSNKAGAFWFPYLCNPKDKATVWAKQTLTYLKREIINDSRSGCSLRKCTEVFRHKVGPPWWADAVDRYERPTKQELPEGYEDGYEIEAVLMDTTIYMDYLVNQFKSLGGSIIQKEILDIRDALNGCPIVINCTGLGSHTLFNDLSIYPVRGQTVKVKPNGFNEVIADDEAHNNLAYIIPRVHDIVLGGTAQVNDWNLNVDPKDTEEILRKCAAIRPEFKNVEIIGVSVGLRPARDVIRLETEEYGEKFVIHNYGHGGAGFTLSWGCAQEVLEKVQKLFN
ncbi:FAD-binding oxidoreductase [Candidatus Gottesmanbacteria bacterium]|nr:FAD-binding oxidoreductase [Candidatus Gottesmanbacteria bacterium]